ncbi:putative member of the kelch motif protein family [Monocercomonoides exilis]|uniref:putative member of the kelch motif protein family n=1 Tax=Monocercomonoides exilis TaxID=2049356 RepID=UPI003559D904|nr:putative member of the kelch motif protein family [Monocercomonoides exilis]|eukprot:MONOS_2636.1-p1 / transcript=MONOS_2636.1 / gene=MONOS_2636 / organism=Monocercomonoides_exilis_PA203 / gene_product=member of the kelch motif protein family / transcript_product=member of the kelch motif protein family / location=Mono_scaffold00055:128575-131736(-) / protein_length=1053 / sequence_SO=supercontig / SO=protein_coding / is_pseudo=false
MVGVLFGLFCIKYACCYEEKQIVKSVETFPAYGSQINPRYSSFVQFFTNNGKDSLFVYGGVSYDDHILTDAYIVEFHPLHIKRLHLPLESKKPLVKNFAQFRVNNTFFIWGGWQDSGFSNALWAFDFSSKEWKEVDEGKTVPEARQSMAYATDGERLYIFGGIGASGLLNDLWEYDTRANQWTKLNISTSADAPEPCFGAGMIVSNGYAVVYGGNPGGNTIPKLKMFRVNLNVASQSWEKVKIQDKNGNESYIPDSRTNFGHSTFSSPNEAFAYIFGGKQANGILTLFNVLLILDLSEVVKSGNNPSIAYFKEISLEKMEMYRFDCTCATDNEGNLFIFGGRTMIDVNADFISVMKEDLSINHIENDIYSDKAIERRANFHQKLFAYGDTVSSLEKSDKHGSSQACNSTSSSDEFLSPFISIIKVNGYAPSPRVNPIVGTRGDSYFVYGGRDPETGEIFNDMYLWRPTNNQWNKVIPAVYSETPPARELASYCHDNGRLLIFGGLGPNPQTGKVEPSNELWEFTFLTCLWKQLGKNSINKPVPVYGAAMEMYMDFLFVIGGRTSYGTKYTIISIFNFQIDTWGASVLNSPFYRPSAFVMDMIDPKNEGKFQNQERDEYKKNCPDNFDSTKVNNNRNLRTKNEEPVSPNVVYLGGMAGAFPFHGFSCIPFAYAMKNPSHNASNGIKADREFVLTYHHQDGNALPLDDKVLMFGGMNDGRAMDTFKIVKINKNRTANVIEDDGTFLANGKHLDVVEAGCAVQKREVFCFGGRQISENRIVTEIAYDSLRIFKLQNDAFECAPGSYQDENGECQFCKAGWYSEEYSNGQCDPCPKGTFGTLRGSRKYGCVPVNSGTYSNSTNSLAFENCTKGHYCPMGSASNNNTYPSHDPSKTKQPELYQISSSSELTANLVSYIASIGIGAAVAFILLCLPSKKYLWKLDGYSNKYVDSLDPNTHKTIKQVKKTTFGGFISIVGMFFVLGAIISNILGIALFNIIETKTTVDATSEENVQLKKIKSTNFRVDLTLMDYSGECVKDSKCSEKLGFGKTVFNPFGL